MTFRKRGKDEINKKFNFKLKNHDNWDDTFEYPYLCEIIEVLLPKISVSVLFEQTDIEMASEHRFYDYSSKIMKIASRID